MDTKLSENTAQQMHKLLQDLANFIALYEQAEDKFKARQSDISKAVQTFSNEVLQRTGTIQQAVHDLNEILSAAGAARWRMAAESAMQQGEAHLKAIQESCHVYQKLADDSVSRLDQVAVMAEKRVVQALSALREDNMGVVRDLKQRTEDTYNYIEKIAKSSIENIRRMLRWLRWDRIIIAVIAGLTAAFVMSVYINAEWPWEAHAKAHRERQVGRNLIKAWPNLSKEQRDHLTKLGVKI